MSTFIDRIMGRFGFIRTTAIPQASNVYGIRPDSNPQRYFQLLDYYYQNNAVYDELTRYARGINTNLQGLQALRNPAFRVVEFYVATVWPGALPDALPVETDNDAIIQPIHDVWKYSNWGAQKQLAVRQLGKFGNMFVKVAQREDGRPYHQLLDALYVSELEEDIRGIVQRFRMDVPKVRGRGTEAKAYTYTEVWDLDGMRAYEHSVGDDVEARLGTPTQTITLADLGVTFIPIVHAKLRDVGGVWGQGAFAQSLDKIDEANRKATRQSQMLFRHNKALWALSANGVGADSRPLPPPKISREDGTAADGEYMASLGDDGIIRLPGTSQINSLIPKIQYNAALAILQDDMAELEEDMPELSYARISRGSDASGKALRIRLTAAIARATEARGNAEAALVRANQIALTLGMNAGVFEGLGTYENGDLDHGFTERDVIPVDENERADTTAKTVAWMKAAGLPDEEIWSEVGYSDEQIAELKTSDSFMAKQAMISVAAGFGGGAG